MKIETVAHRKNQLMGREEAELKIHHHGQRTPTRAELLRAVAAHLKAGENLVVIDKIFTVRGEAVSTAKVHAYEKAEKIPAYKLEKMKRRMKASKEAAPAAKPEERPEKAAAGKKSEH
jgi:ribosomal protein S24E